MFAGYGWCGYLYDACLVVLRGPKVLEHDNSSSQRDQPSALALRENQAPRKAKGGPTGQTETAAYSSAKSRKGVRLTTPLPSASIRSNACLACAVQNSSNPVQRPTEFNRTFTKM